MTLGKRIKKLRQDKGLTQAQLGYMVNKGESTVRTWELDRSQPSPQTIRLLCDVLGTTPNALLGKEEKEEPVEMVTIDNNILGKRLRAARGDMSICEFAKKCNISPPQQKAALISEFYKHDPIKLLLSALNNELSKQGSDKK